MLRIIAGANGYLDNPTGFTLTSTIGGKLGGYYLIGSFFDDQTNSLNGQGFSVTGLDIGDFDPAHLSDRRRSRSTGSGPTPSKAPMVWLRA